MGNLRGKGKKRILYWGGGVNAGGKAVRWTNGLAFHSCTCPSSRPTGLALNMNQNKVCSPSMFQLVACVVEFRFTEL